MRKAKDQILSILRDKTTPLNVFRRNTDKLTGILVAETALLLDTESFKVTTPVAEMSGIQFNEEILLVPILRAGLSMLPSYQTYFENASVGILGYYRDKNTCTSTMYYENIPTVNQSTRVIIIDPMLATGGTACAAIRLLNKRSVKDSKIIFSCILASPEGKKYVKEMHPDVKMVIGKLDEKLNDAKYILPGIGDFGDRYFGTC